LLLQQQQLWACKLNCFIRRRKLTGSSIPLNRCDDPPLGRPADPAATSPRSTLKPATPDATFNEAGLRPTAKADRGGFPARSSLKRSDYDLKTHIPYRPRGRPDRRNRGDSLIEKGSVGVETAAAVRDEFDRTECCSTLPLSVSGLSDARAGFRLRPLTFARRERRKFLQSAPLAAT